MNASGRILLAVAIVLVDLVVFAVPLTAFFAAYVVLVRPPWFREWVRELYDAAWPPGADDR